MTTALVVFGLAVLVGGVRRFRRRTRFVPLRMSDAWIRDHTGDPLADHLR